MLTLLLAIMSLDLTTITPEQAYIAWVDAYQRGDGKTVYALYNAYGQSMCLERAGSDDEAKLNDAALFFACRLLYQEEKNPPIEKIAAKRMVNSSQKLDEKSCMLFNGDGDTVMLMNESKGWKVDNVFSKDIMKGGRK